MNIVCASKMQAAITGSKTFSCSCPASAAIVIVRSLPMTRKQTMFTTSGITGFTLPGMIDEPGCFARQVDLAQPAARTGREQPQVVADLRELDREALHARRVEDERLRVLRRLDQIGGEVDAAVR